MKELNSKENIILVSREEKLLDIPDYENIKKFQEKYKNLSFSEMKEEIFDRLKGFFGGDGIKKVNLEETYALLERYLQVAKAIPKKMGPRTWNEYAYPSNFRGYDLLELFDVFDNSGRIEEKDKWKLNKTFRLIMGLTKKYPEQARIFYGFTSSIFEFVDPDTFFDEYIDICSQPETANLYRDDLLSQLEYNMSFGGAEKYANALVSRLDFNHQENFSKTSQFLDLTRIIYNIGKSGSYSERYHIDEHVKNVLTEAINKKQGSYFLNIKAQEILDQMNKDYPISGREDVFEIEKGVWAVFKDNGIYISSREDYAKIIQIRDEIKEFSEELDSPPQHLIDEAIKNGETEVWWTPDQSKFHFRQSLQQKVLDFCNHKIGIQDLSNKAAPDISQDFAVQDYMHIVRKTIREKIEKDFNLSLNELSLKEQYQLLTYLKQKTSKEMKDTFSFAQKFSTLGFRTFLSLEHGGFDMGQKILDLGAQLPPETASKIFAKYAEIIDSVENVLSVAQNNFKSSIDTKPELMQSIEQSLYKRGADLLLQFHDNLNQNPEEVIAELERINTDTITTLSIFKYAAKFGNKLPLEDITGAEFSKKTGNELSQAEIAEMEHIYQSNWKNYGNQQLIQSVIQKFKESLTGEHAVNEQVYTFKKNNQINAFVKFSELQSGVKYTSALNVDQSSKGFGLGETMMDEALYREAQENILIATCDPYNDSNMRYFEKGFVGTGFTGDNPPVMNICWNESMNIHISSKFISVDDLVMLYLKKQVPNNLVIKKGKTLQEIHTNIPTGKSLTRCFKDPLHTGDWYAVYESIPVEYETKIKTTQ